MDMKRVVSIQDISCVGKCSLTVALPIISAMGIETSILPTAVLSTHTMFKGFTFRDLTSDITPIVEHWKKEKFEFAKLGIPVNAELEFIHDRSIKVVVADEKRTVLYNGEEWSLSALAKVLLKRNSTVQGTLHFSYNGETIADLRNRLEGEDL